MFLQSIDRPVLKLHMGFLGKMVSFHSGGLLLAAFKEIKIELEWIGSGLNEVGIFNDETMVKVSREFYRPLESYNYRADYSKAKKKLK